MMFSPNVLLSLALFSSTAALEGNDIHRKSIECPGYGLDACLMSGDRTIKEPQGCKSKATENCVAGTWAASMIEDMTRYDAATGETVVTYRVNQVGKKPGVSHVTASWGGNCCVTSATSFSISSPLEFGLDPTTCSYGLKFDEGFPDSQNQGIYEIRFAGQVPLVEGGGSLTVKGGREYCKIPVKGPNCSGCIDSGGDVTPVSSPTDAPVPSPTDAPIPSPPTDAPAPSPTGAPIPSPTDAPGSDGTTTPSPVAGTASFPPGSSEGCAPKAYASGTCLVNGDPTDEEPGCTNDFTETCDGTWAANMVDEMTSYDAISDETIVIYNVDQLLQSPAVSHVTASWGGNCCVKNSSFYGSSIDYGQDPTTCAFGVKFDDGFEGGRTKGTYTIRFAGQVSLIEGAGSITVKGGLKYCKIPVKGPDCNRCDSTGTLTAAPVVPSPETSSPIAGGHPQAAETTAPSFSPSSSPTASASISGKVLEDKDSDSEFDYDGPDVPIQSVVIILENSDGEIIKMINTNELGEYSFSGLAPGTYAIREIDGEGFISVNDIDGDQTDNIIQVVLAAGESSIDNDYLDVRTVKISGKVTEDIDNDNVGDDPIGGVPITLCKKSDIGDCKTTSTDSDGLFSFETVSPGEWCVTETNIGDYIDVGDSITSNEGNELEDGTTDDPNLVCVVVAGVDIDDIEFVDELPSAEPSATPSSSPTLSGSLSGTVYEDSDANGDFSGGDTPIAGVEIQLKKEGSVVAIATTDNEGRYTFTGLSGGTYSVVEQPLDGMIDVKDIDGDENGKSLISVVLFAGGNSEGNDFLEATVTSAPSATPTAAPTTLGSIAGKVLEDTDDNLAIDAFDAPLAGVNVTLFKDGEPIAQTATDSLGLYSFTGLSPGDYTVHELNLEGYVDVTDVDGGDPNQIIVPLAAGEHAAEKDFLDDKSAMELRTISGTVKRDINFNFQGDVPMPNILITLVGPDGVVATTVTDSNGVFTFSDVEPGVYEVQEDQPQGFLNRNDSDGEGTPDEIHNVDVTEADRLDLFFVNWTFITGEGRRNLRASSANRAQGASD